MKREHATARCSAVLLCSNTFSMVSWLWVARMGRCRATSRHNGRPLYRILPVSWRVLPTRCCHAVHILRAYVSSLYTPLQCACLRNSPLCAPTHPPHTQRCLNGPDLSRRGNTEAVATRCWTLGQLSFACHVCSKQGHHQWGLVTGAHAAPVDAGAANQACWPGTGAPAAAATQAKPRPAKSSSWHFTNACFHACL